ncbi:MAG TPA: ribonuclease activity regulator RraA, partial [Xanthobacteraceae bacterium]
AKQLIGEGERVVGEAFTLRFIPVREDMATTESWANPVSTRTAIEEMPAGCIAVADARGVKEAAIFGDILAMRMKVRGVAALVTDGMLRDLDGMRATGLPTWCGGVAAPPSVGGLTFIDWQKPIGCGGVAIYPGDIIIADKDGAVCIPKAMVAAVAADATEQEAFEAWVFEEVKNGAALPGTYPPNDQTKARYEAAKKKGR